MTASWAEVPALEANRKYNTIDVQTGKNLGVYGECDCGSGNA
jgi:hypothetical protein